MGKESVSERTTESGREEGGQDNGTAEAGGIVVVDGGEMTHLVVVVVGMGMVVVMGRGQIEEEEEEER